MAIRFNDDDLLHEVPHQKRADGGKDYKNCEIKLGERASHGCIRVQRLRTPNGMNMKWIWAEMKNELGTRIVIWEDYQGRSIPIPADDIALFYNTKGGKNYHDSPTCFGVRDEYLPMKEFSYGELEDDEYKNLTSCSYCVPPLRESMLISINENY